jgi:hypothetical protein
MKTQKNIINIKNAIFFNEEKYKNVAVPIFLIFFIF